MTDTDGLVSGEPEQLQVAFPASPTFTRIGRVAVVGLALRLGHDVATVEKLRTAVDDAVQALQGSGRIEVRAAWTASQLLVTLDNPQAQVAEPEAVTERLAELVSTVTVDSTTIQMALDLPSG
ncbi:MAG: hypothetical protein AAFO29_12395 [Actinomycetota bacterium]